MTARYEDALEGWEIFKESGYSVSLTEINAELRRRGLRAVSGRMFQHYHKLFRYGYEEYLPINQLDVKTLENPVWDAAVRKRYAFREASVDVDVRLLARDELLTFRGLASRISDSTMVVRFSDGSAVAYFSEHKRRRETPLDILLIATGELLRGSLDSIYIEMRRDVAVLRINLDNPSLVDDLGLRQPLDERRLRITIEPRRADVFLGDIVQSFYWIFQGIEAARVASEDILLSFDPQRQYGLPPSRIRTISLSSPLRIDLLTNAPTVVLALGVVRALLALRNSFLEADNESSEATQREADERVQTAIAQRLKWETRRGQLSKQIDTGPTVDQASQSVRALLRDKGVEPVRAPADQADRVNSVVEGQIVPAFLSLIEAVGDAEIGFEEEDERGTNEEG